MKVLLSLRPAPHVAIGLGEKKHVVGQICADDRLPTCSRVDGASHVDEGASWILWQ